MGATSGATTDGTAGDLRVGGAHLTQRARAHRDLVGTEGAQHIRHLEPEEAQGVGGYFERFGKRIAHVHVVDGTPACVDLPADYAGPGMPCGLGRYRETGDRPEDCCMKRSSAWPTV